MHRVIVLVATMLCLAGIAIAETPPTKMAPASAYNVSPGNCPHVSLDIAALQAQERSAFARGDVSAARELERQVQALLIQQQHAVPEPAPVNVAVPPRTGVSFAPDQPIYAGTVTASSTDWEMDGTMWAAFASQAESLTKIYKSTDHGANWSFVAGFFWLPKHIINKIELVVGPGDSGFVYVFENVPANNGDLLLARFNKDGMNALGFGVLGGADTITDFTVCRDFSGSNYWLYAVAFNGAQGGNYPRTYALRSTDYGVTWAVTDSMYNMGRPRLAFGAGPYGYASYLPPAHTFQGVVGTGITRMWSSPGTWWWVDFKPDTFPINDACIAPAFAFPLDTTVWLAYAHNVNGSGDWDVLSAYATDTLLNWVGPDTVAGTGHVEAYVDLKNYTSAGNTYVNLSYCDIDLAGHDNAWLGYSSVGAPSNWTALSSPWVNQSGCIGWGFNTFPRIVYSPGGPGTGGGLVFTGAGNVNGYFNAPWYGYPPPVADSLYFKSYMGTALMCAAKSANPAPSNRVPMAFQQSQSVPCMDPLGNYVYEVSSSNLRRFSTETGSYTDIPLSHPGDITCATDGNFIFVPNGSDVYKYTMTGTYVNTTTLNISCDRFSFALVNDTVWASPDREGEVFYGYAATRFTGGSLTEDQQWAVGPGTHGTGNIAWDGTYYCIPWIGTSPITFKRFTAARTLHDSGEVSIDPRSVMCPWAAVAVAEPAGASLAPAALLVFPNPLRSGPATLRCGLHGTGPATVTLYDVAGRSVCRRVVPAQRNGSVQLDLRNLSGGVYLVRLDAGAHAAVQKLVVQR